MALSPRPPISTTPASACSSKPSTTCLHSPPATRRYLNAAAGSAALLNGALASGHPDAAQLLHALGQAEHKKRSRALTVGAWAKATFKRCADTNGLTASASQRVHVAPVVQGPLFLPVRPGPGRRARRSSRVREGRSGGQRLGIPSRALGKTVTTVTGPGCGSRCPRDRNDSFDLKIVPKGQRRLPSGRRFARTAVA